MKIFIKILAYIYMWLLMPVIDVVFMIYQWVQWKRWSYEFQAEEMIYWEMVKDDPEAWMRVIYRYLLDPLKGYLNYNWLLPFQAMYCKFQGDCDKYATMWKWLKPGGKRYSIIYRDKERLFGWYGHVVYSVDGKTYDQNMIHNVGIDRFKAILYEKAIIIKMPY